MLKNYLRLSIKSIVNQGHQSILSVIGLSVALSCSILILLYVQYEFSYDSYHDNADNIYRVIIRQPENSYMGNNLFAVTAGPLKEALINEIPEITRATKCTLRSHTLDYNASIFAESGFLYADTDFLKIFSFPVLTGNPSKDLARPFNLYITRDMASKYFGKDDPVGKSILADNKYVFTVCGILRIFLTTHISTLIFLPDLIHITASEEEEKISRNGIQIVT
ncbi:MAG: ABC transporter permease [Bacteroidales bacterium]|nr:ABC transporter permease [Bacteroidales bacterium]